MHDRKISQEITENLEGFVFYVDFECKKCKGEMKPGKAIMQTWTGIPDFPGDKSCITMSPGGRGKLIDCLKCTKCGYSETV